MRNNVVMFLAISVSLIVFLFITTTDTVNAGSGPNEGCSVIINKSASPADNTSFTFQSNFIGNFVLQDPANNSASYPIGVGAVEEVVEIVPDGWELVDVQCVSMGVVGDNIENGVGFECLTIGGFVECTFINEGPETPPAQVPTLSQWGLGTIVALMLAVSIFTIYRRRKAAA